jgi:oligopeptide transport system ATP-binding protein
MSERNALLDVSHLKKTFRLRSGGLAPAKLVQAVSDVSLAIRRGETFGLVGESGCGKSTLGRMILKICEPDSGRILFDGVDITHLGAAGMRPFRRRMQMIFQDPYASLNPRFTVGDTVREPMEIHHLCGRKESEERVRLLLETVGLKNDHIQRYPHEFSGGQRQRIGIMRALAPEPDFIVCDEPFSALDVSIQAQIINLLERIQDEKDIAYLMITHNLTAVRHISHQVGVMYLGRLVECGPAQEVCGHPAHPYTKALIASVPVPDPHKAERDRMVLEGEAVSPIGISPGCAFAGRCRYCMNKCREAAPEMKSIGGRQVACHLF